MANQQAGSPAAQTVGTIPQTTVAVPAGGSFVRYANDPGSLPAYTNPGIAFGGRSQLPLSAVSGFLKGLKLTVTVVGSSSTTTAAMAADAPWNIISSLDFRDSGGNAIYQPYDGFSLFLVNLYSGQCGNGGTQDPRTLPSYVTAVTASGTATGTFSFKLYIPLAINSSMYCSLPSDNSAELPKLSVVFAASSAVYSTAPSAVGTITLSVELDFAPIPSNYAGLAPFDDGASAQWWINNSAQQPPSAASARILDQSVGQFIHSKIYVFRDGSNVRQDVFPSTDFQYYIDNYAYISQTFIQDIYDEMAKAYAVGASVWQARPTGVIALPFWRQSVKREVDDADDLERILVTTGSTKLEVAGTWGTFSGVGQLVALTGQVFPGPSGWPYGSQSYVVQPAAA